MKQQKAATVVGLTGGTTMPKNKQMLRRQQGTLTNNRSELVSLSTLLTHLAKRPSDPKRKGAQEKTPFSETVFHIRSHGVLHFVVSVGFRNH